MMKLTILGLPLVLLPLLSGCATSDPTSAVLLNQYPGAADASTSNTSVTVFQAWWTVALFADPVLAGQISDPVRVVQGTDYAYALLAPGWEPASGTPPPQLIPIRTSQKLTAARGDTLNIAISDATTLGNCLAGSSLSQADADFITQRIFPGPFSDSIYDPMTCTSSVGPEGAGGASNAEGGEAGALTALGGAGAGG